MATNDSQTLRLKGPADLLAFVPYALGFHLRESLLLVGLAGTRLVVTARLDIVDATLEVVSSACGTLRRNGATAVAGIIVTDHPDLTSEVQRHVTEAAGHAGLGVLDVLLVTGDRWYSLHNADPGPVRPPCHVCTEFDATESVVRHRPRQMTHVDL